MCLYHRVMSPNNAGGMANSVDPDQTAPLGAVWSGSALFAQTCLSENLGTLRYIKKWRFFWIHDIVRVELYNRIIISFLTSFCDWISYCSHQIPANRGNTCLNTIQWLANLVHRIIKYLDFCHWWNFEKSQNYLYRADSKTRRNIKTLMLSSSFSHRSSFSYWQPLLNYSWRGLQTHRS